MRQGEYASFTILGHQIRSPKKSPAKLLPLTQLELYQNGSLEAATVVPGV